MSSSEGHQLDKSKQHFVETFQLTGISEKFYGTIGLYGHVGPYMMEIACSHVHWETKDVSIIEDGHNFTFADI